MLQNHIRMLKVFLGQDCWALLNNLASTNPMLKNKAINKKIIIDK